MKRILFFLLAILFISEDAFSECFIQFYGVPRQCPCTPIILATRDEAVSAAQAECGGTTYYNSGNCYGVDDLRVGAMCSRPLPDPDPEKHCWSIPLPPFPGGCCGQGNCYYYIPEPEECCPEDEQQGACCEGKKCPASEVGNPINVLTGNNRSSETDLFFSTAHEKGFKLYRTYNSRIKMDSPIGYGWRHNYQVALEAMTAAGPNTFTIRDESSHLHYFQDHWGEGRFVGVRPTSGSLTFNMDNSYTWHRPNGITYTFDQYLNFVSKTDGNANVQTLTYDSNNRLASITDEATGRTMGFTYTSNDRIASITGPITTAVPDGIWVRYQYDTPGNLISAQYADNGNGSASSGFEYKYEDPNQPHNLTEKRNLAGEFLSSWQYNSQDRAFKNITRDGKGVTISYGYPIVVTDSHGVRKNYHYTMEAVSQITRLTGISGGGCASCGGDAVRYGYDDKNRVNEIEYASGRIDQYTDFDTQGRYQTEIQAVGTPQQRSLHYTYHPETGEKLSIIEASILGPGNKETIFDYDDGNTIPNQTPTRRLQRMIERGYTYNEAGTIAAYELITAYTYNAKGQVVSIDGPLPGNQDRISYTYDPVTGDRLTETRPLAGTTHYSYDPAGNLETILEPDGTLTTITHDGRNRQLSVTRNGITESRTYTAAGELDTTTDALGRNMHYAYNSAGFMEKITDPSGNFIFHGYDAHGRRTQESIFGADNTQTHFRATDWGDPRTNPNLSSAKPWKSLHRNAADTADLETVYAYDSSGNLTAVTDAQNNTTEYHYDLFDRLIQVIQPGHTVTTYSYDAQGNLSSVTDAEGNFTRYDYDDLGRLVETDSPDTGTTFYHYDPAGNLRGKVLNGKPTEYRYDALGRLTHILYDDPAENVTMTYDTGAGANLLGRLASVSDAAGSVAYSYDEDGRLESELRTIDDMVFETIYGYDDAGNLRTLIYPTGQSIEYLPDPADPARIGAVVLNGTRTLAAELTYKPFGPMTAMTLEGGLQVLKTYDKNYQINTILSGQIMHRTYNLDNVGNIKTITDHLDPSRTQRFDYDRLYRLTNAEGNYGTISYAYDKVGNRTRRTHDTDQHDQYTYYPGTNRLQAITGTHAELFQYDADGNTTQRIPGAANTQPEITDPPQFDYNSSGQRTKKEAAATIYYHYDQSGQLIAETDTAGTLLKAYIWLHGQPLAMIDATGELYYYHVDHLGTPQKLTRANSTEVVWAADYLPFGQADVIVAAVESNLRFAGQYFDSETGLHYNYWRYYDPKLGRYLRADPIGLEGGINHYSYVQNNPSNKIDPFGLADCDECAYCPNGKWDVNMGLTASAAIVIGANASDITFTCLSNNKKCKGKFYCGIAGAIIDIGVGWVVDFKSIGGGRTLSGKCDKSDIQDYIVRGTVLTSPVGTASGNTVSTGKGFSIGIGYAWCHADYVRCDD